jgi:enoyl-CoA hydratase/carnithine racemase
MDATRDLARRVLRHSPLVAAGILRAVTRGLNATIAEGLLIEAEQFVRLAPSRDSREGLQAWMERRRSRYGGA